MKLNLLLAILLLLVAISQAAPIRTIEKRDEDCGSIGDIGKRHEGQSCRDTYQFDDDNAELQQCLMENKTKIENYGSMGTVAPNSIDIRTSSEARNYEGKTVSPML
ncbi:hypothetical protein RhiirA1_529056 [Rhizophagus irregularis]|uniref:Uncharacterized protein n=1 Tax=Rhizophagus irregularis TaxID=588596 RepID=A0A2N0SHT8_9GLOM|nr:hypothetical protein RhiirA1_529056 [Rhizophagus irregularis]